MEVHAHSHTEGKKIKHYLWEFLMLFLAIFLGFIAENTREHIVEKQKGKNYLESLFQDVKLDTAKFTVTISWFEKAQKKFDTLLEHFDDLSLPEYPAVFIQNGELLQYYEDFVYTDRTIQQLKNAGGLRLISDKVAVDSIVNYDGCVRLQEAQLVAVDKYQTKVEDLTEKILNFKKIVNHIHQKDDPLQQKNGWLLINDKTELGYYFNAISDYKFMCQRYLDLLNKSKETGTRLLFFLHNKYHFI
jgi:hypothetical protein